MLRTGAWAVLFLAALLAAAAWIRSNARPDDILLHVQEIAHQKPALVCREALVAGHDEDLEPPPPARAAACVAPSTDAASPPPELEPVELDELRQEIGQARREGRYGEVELLSFRYRLETFRRKAGRDRSSEARAVLVGSIQEILRAQGRMLPPNAPSVHATEQAWADGWRYLTAGGQGAFTFHVDEFPAYEVLRVANLDAAQGEEGPGRYSPRRARHVPESTYDEIEEQALVAFALLQERVFEQR